MTFEALGLEVVARLQEAGIPYMLTGALAVSYHGVPRATHDIDIVILIASTDILRVKALFEQDFFIDDESIRAALREGSMFNAVHKDTGLKVDFWLRKDDAYGHEAFQRRTAYPYQDVQVLIAMPEDVIVSKLEWFKKSDIDKHYSDALGVYRIQAGKLDKNYINNWCRRKSLLELWQEVQDEAAQ